MKIESGSIVTMRGRKGLAFRVHEIEVDDAGEPVLLEIFGGPRRQWRSVKPDAVKPAEAAKRREFLRVMEQEEPLRRAIRPKKPVGAGKKGAA